MDALVRQVADAAGDRPILIAGPTASGKSALALALAEATGRRVVNADALQVYEGWRVLTARPTPDEEARAPHVLFGTVGMEETWSGGHWLRAVMPHLRDAPVIVGGTGLYFDALTRGLADVPPVPPEVRAEADRLDLDRLVAGLDAATAARIDRANRARVQRAWEVLRATGRGLAEWQAGTKAPLADGATRVVLTPEPVWLDARIARRFNAMLAGGAVEEVDRLRPVWRRGSPAFRALGAEEIRDWIEGSCDRETMRAAAILATRRYAKRQRTWGRNRMADWWRVDPATWSAT